MNKEDYLPLSESPHFAVAEKLRESLPGCESVKRLVEGLPKTTAEQAVGLGPRESDIVQEPKADSLDSLGCLITVVPSDEVTLENSQGADGSDSEISEHKILCYRRLDDHEIKAIGLVPLYLWFWSLSTALPRQLREAATSCVQIRTITMDQWPAYNSREQQEAEGLVLSFGLAVTTGDAES